MTTKEEKFEIGLTIYDKGKIIRFLVRKKWEVEWKNKKGIRIGAVSPKKLQFERDNKKYQVLIDVSIIEKWYFRYGIYDSHIGVPPGVDYEIYYSNEPKPEPKRGEISKTDNYVELVDVWKKGEIVLFVSFVLILIIIIVFIIRRKKLKK